MLDFEMWGLGWTRWYPTDFCSFLAWLQFIFIIEQWSQTWPRSASFAKFGIFRNKTKLSNIWFIQLISSHNSFLLIVVACCRWAQLMQLLTEEYWKAGLLVEWHFRNWRLFGIFLQMQSPAERHKIHIKCMGIPGSRLHPSGSCLRCILYKVVRWKEPPFFSL
jgi:hypothetical protein